MASSTCIKVWRRGVAATLVTLAVALSGPTAMAAENGDSQGDTLRAVTLVYRHSVVSPKYELPKINVQWPMGYRQLTAIGIRDTYEKGQALRRRYVKELGLVSERYRAGELYVRASNEDRSLQTAQMLMLGMFPLGTGPDPAHYDKSLEAVPSTELAFTPIPIHAVSLEEDKELRPWTGDADCKKYRKFAKSIAHTALYREQASRHEDFLVRMASTTGLYEGEDPAQILADINEMYEPLEAQLRHNIPLPAGISGQDLERLSELSDWNYHHLFLGKAVGRLTGGPFIGELVNNFSNHIKGNGAATNMYVYSGHQRTILGVDAALGIETAHAHGPMFKGRIVPLGSHYAFELHEVEDGSYALRLKFVTDESEQIIPLPGCGGDMCPFDRFVETVADVIPTDWRRECSS